MLATANLQTIVLTARPDEAAAFYRDVLELPTRGRSDGALVFTVGDTSLRLAAVEETSPSEHTVAGFSVSDVDRVVAWLGERGVTIERFEKFPHRENGVLVTPDKARVAWFRDLDGNLLSVVEVPSPDY